MAYDPLDEVDTILRELISWGEILTHLPDETDREAIRIVAHAMYDLAKQLQGLVKKQQTERDWRRQDRRLTRLMKKHHF